MNVRRQLLHEDADPRQGLGEVLHVAAAAERFARARDDDAADSGVLVHFQGRGEQVAAEGEVQRVVRLGPVQRDRGDAIGAVQQQGLVRHGALSVSPPAAGVSCSPPILLQSPDD